MPLWHKIISLPKRIILRKIRNILFPPKSISEEKIYQTICSGINQSGSSLYNLLVVYRSLRNYLSLIGENIANQHILEIGTSKSPGLPLIFLLAGCRHYSASNIAPIDKKIDKTHADLLYLILSALLDVDKPRLEKILIRSETENSAVFNPDFYSDFSPADAERITIASDSLDGIFSISVLEHVNDPLAVLQNTFRMLKPGGWFCHTIDLRDHADFTQPLAFLKYSEEEYKTEIGATENRVRAEGFLALLKQTGFIVEQIRIQDRNPVSMDTFPDIASLMLQDFDQLLPRRSIEEITPWVTEELRASLHPDFREKSLKNLSALGMVVVGHRPLGGYKE